MEFFTPKEVVNNYSDAGVKKSNLSTVNTLLLSILAGLLIACGAAVTNTGVHSVDNVGLARILCGLLFPFGLGMVILSGAELFTGNCLICISVLDRRVQISKMLRNLVLVFTGNFIGAICFAGGCAFFGQMNYSGGQLAVYTIKVAAGKCAIPFSSGIVLGLLCNILVCLAVFCSYAAKDATGRILGAYIPVLFFVICGFEHCIANMYYIPAGLFALQVPEYAQLAIEAGVNLSVLSWRNFLVHNLIPVTIGNIIGGLCLGMLFWRTQRPVVKTAVQTARRKMPDVVKQQ